jgi:DNA ligase (NAD+)
MATKPSGAKPPAAAQARVKELRGLIEYHTERYFVEDQPEIADGEFDALVI